ncbi:MAG TPA: metallopeptidase TldD-related protein [Polyangiaceae bacterium]|jgi:predicted Zn-dependent protease
MRERFFELCDHGAARLRDGEVLLAHFAGEESDFVRFNHARIRQAMTIRQAYLTLTLIDGQRRDSLTLTISDGSSEDRARVERALAELRQSLAGLTEDPYLLYSREPASSERVERGHLPEPAEALDAILSAAGHSDLVGIYACGPIFRGFASSLGHRHWHEVGSMQLDWSLYHATDKAVSRSYSTANFERPELESKILDAQSALVHLAKAPKTIEPGGYRAYLSPAAVAELVSMLNWGGLSEQAQRTKASSLQKLVDGEARLSEKFTLLEHTAAGLAPSFDEVGFSKPASVALIREGKHVGSLIGPRTAKEFGLTANADGDETLHSAEIAAGALASADALAALDTGVYIGNLWYLNYSDRTSARITGMTRFATFWVEKGQIVAPLNVMRFDDSLYRILGENLLDLTRERELLLSNASYGGRSVETNLLPGALLRELTFTL